MRLRLVRDDDCHWYAIPAADTNLFDLWVDSTYESSIPYDGPNFDKYRIDNPSVYTFIDLQRD